MTDKTPGGARDEVLRLSAQITAAFVSNNSTAAADIPALIGEVHRALRELAEPPAPARGPRPKPAVPVKASIQNDYLVCLEDGKRFKVLKRYLRTRYGMTPDQYRLKWGLPSEYPMVAPAYAAVRSQHAKTIGLGRRPRSR
jgi:predicted transcriptional regulator